MANVGDQAEQRGDVMRRIVSVSDAVRIMQTIRRMESASIGRGGIRIDGEGVIRSATFDGDLSVGDPGSAGWALGQDQLVLQGQFVGPVAFGGARDVQFGISIDNTLPGPVKASAVMQVPPWADEAIVMATADCTGDNTSAQDNDAFFVHAKVGGVNGHENMASVHSGRQTPNSASFERLITNPGDTITVACGVRTNIASWGPGNSRAAINAIAVFRRSS